MAFLLKLQKICCLVYFRAYSTVYTRTEEIRVISECNMNVLILRLSQRSATRTVHIVET